MRSGLRTRRQLLRGGLALAGSGLLAGCQLPRLPWQAERIPTDRLSRGRLPRPGLAPPWSTGCWTGYASTATRRGRNIAFEYRFSDGRDERLPELAAELVALQVDLIVASGTPASFAAAEATTDRSRS